MENIILNKITSFVDEYFIKLDNEDKNILYYYLIKTITKIGRAHV